MTSWTPPKTWTEPSNLTATEMNTEVRDNLKNLDERLTVLGQTSPSTIQRLNTDRYGCAYLLTGQSISGGGGDYAVQFPLAGEEFSDDSGFHNGTYPTRFYATITGLYRCSAWLSYAPNATGNREAWFLSGGYEFNRQTSVSGLATKRKTLQIDYEMPLTAGGYVEVYTAQDSLSALSLNARMQFRLVAR